MDVSLLCSYAKSFISVPYNFGGDDPLSGFDCSGLVSELLRAAGLVPYNYRSNAQGIHDMLLRRFKKCEPRAGAVVFFGKDSASVVHVGFCLDDYTMIEAGGGDSTTNPETASPRNAFVRLRPAKYRRDYLYAVGVVYDG